MIQELIEIFVVFVLLFTHFVGDFAIQTEWQARNKSKRWDALLYHTVTYTLIFFPAIAVMLSFTDALIFCLVTFLTHTIIDYITSRVNAVLAKKAREKDDYHNFFVSIGFDQMLHLLQLFATYILLS